MTTPVIHSIEVHKPMGRVRVMTTLSLHAVVESERPVRYRWYIVQKASGRERIIPDSRLPNLANLELWWDREETAHELVGKQVVVAVEAWYEGGEENPAQEIISFTIDGIKAKPIPRIGGLGVNTPETPHFMDPVDGKGVGFSSHETTDPDEEGFSARWGVDRTEPSGVRVTTIGGEGHLFSTLVAYRSYPVKVTVRVRIFSHLHEVDATADAYFAPAPQPEPEPPDDGENGDEKMVEIQAYNGSMVVTGKQAEWLVTEDYVTPPGHIGIPWTSTYTVQQILVKLEDYVGSEPDPEPEPIPTPPAHDGKRWGIPVRVRPVLNMDTGIYIFALEETTAHIEFIESDPIPENPGLLHWTTAVTLGPKNPYIKNIWQDLQLNVPVDLVLVTANKSIPQPLAIWQPPAGSPVTFAGFSASPL